MSFFFHSPFLKLEGEKKEINLSSDMNGGEGKTRKERDVLTDSAKVSGSLLSLMFLEEESTEHLQEVVFHVGAGVVCPISAIFLVLEEFRFPAHCHYICCVL